MVERKDAHRRTMPAYLCIFHERRLNPVSNYKRSNCTDKSMSGIYSILNTKNGKRYVGQTYDLDYRWKRHRFDLSHNYHSNKHLQSAWNKYGSEVFEYSVLEMCQIENLDERESWWIDYFDCLKSGYNQAAGGIGCRGYKHTDEEISKMRKLQNPKPVLQLDRDLSIIARWESASQAAKTLDVWALAIKNCCSKKAHVKSVGGFIWAYEKDYNTIDKEYYLSGGSEKPTPVLQYDLSMTFIKSWSSVYSASKETGYHHSDISNAAYGKRKTAGGYIWRFSDSYSYVNYLDDLNTYIRKHNTQKIKVAQYTLDGKFIGVHDSIKQAAIITNVSRRAIRNSCNNPDSKPVKFKWKYV